MRQIVMTVGPLAAASPNNIALTQTPTTAGFTINGSTATAGVATLDVARRVLLTTAADEHTKTVLLSGTDAQGRLISETIAGANVGTTQSVLDYLTVTSAIPSANFTGAATIGTDGVASGTTIPLDHYGWPEDAVQVVTNGTINYTVQQTLDNPYGSASTALNWFDFSDPNLVAQTANSSGGVEYPPAALRLLINSGTGSAKITVLQPGILG